MTSDTLAHPKTGTGRASRRSTKAALTGYTMLLPALLLLITFIVIPAGLALGLGFTNARLVSPNPPSYVGLTNFSRLFADPVFLKSLLNVGIFALVVVPIQSGFALILATLVNSKIRGTTFFRTVYFFPVVTSMVVVSLLWMFMYRKDGLFNVLIEKITFGLIQGPDWINDPNTALPAIIVMSIWQAVGFHMIIWLSGLQTIPGELYEASSLDGASKWQTFRFVTWPGLTPTRNLVLITITIQALSLFTQIDVMTQGGPLNATSTVVFQAVRTGFAQQETGYASAISAVFFLIVLTISTVQRFLTREK